MKIRIEPGNISGRITAPPSKSMTQRVLAGAMLHQGTTIIKNVGTSDDEKAALGIIEALGAVVTVHEHNIIEVEGNTLDTITRVLTNATDLIDCGESGLSARLFTPIAALSSKEITVTGTGSLLKRPMKLFETILPQLGVLVSSTNHCLPITLKGPLVPGHIEIDGSESSQFLSGLLFAFCDAAPHPENTMKVHNLKSKPYIDMTLYVLKKFGHIVEHEDYRTFYIRENITPPAKEIEVTIEGDWSSAAGLLIAGAIAGEITIAGLADNNIQADNVIISLLQEAGAIVEWQQDAVTVKAAPLKAFEFDATDCPDLFPVLAVLAACCVGESYITGVHRLFHKESNRAESISEMLQNFDVPFSVEDDALCVYGVGKLQGTIIDSYHDHRIVMAATIGALRANGPVDIVFAESVNKSYPDFFKDFMICGGKYEFLN